jgi:hypothetical protein
MAPLVRFAGAFPRCRGFLSGRGLRVGAAADAHVHAAPGRFSHLRISRGGAERLPWARANDLWLGEPWVCLCGLAE